MADMNRPPEEPGRGAPPVGGENPIEKNQSIYNPVDAAMMASQGQIRKGMTVKDLIENVFKVPIDAPAEQLMNAVKKQAATRTTLGKARMMGANEGQRPQGPPPQGPPQGGENLVPPQRPQGNGGRSAAPRQGLDDLLGR